MTCNLADNWSTAFALPATPSPASATAARHSARCRPDALASPKGVQILAGNCVPEGAQPVALAYAGPPGRSRRGDAAKYGTPNAAPRCVRACVVAVQ